MNQNVKTLKKNGDHTHPDFMTVETDFFIGEELDLRYYIQTNQASGAGYVSAFQPGALAQIGRFLVTDLYANALVSPPSVLIELQALDIRFCLRYPAEKVMLLEEAELLRYIHRDICPELKGENHNA